jgi:UDPglucose 6-dehydrogenase
LSEYLKNKKLNLLATTKLKEAVEGANFVIVCTPTDYDPDTNYFNTESVEAVVSEVVAVEPKANIIIKSTIPIGFIDKLQNLHSKKSIIFSPEFLREGSALYDNLYPSRIIVGGKSDIAASFANLLKKSCLKPDVDMLLTSAKEAEAIKLFANTYLAMRVAFFNELDSFAMINGLNAKEMIDGIALDTRIGKNYNNPSFGYGGYCLPKDTKQLLANYDSIPQNLISAIVSSNDTRKKLISDTIVDTGAKIVGIYKLSMKSGSDNFRQSAVHDIINRLHNAGLSVVIHEPTLNSEYFGNYRIENNIDRFINETDLIIANRSDQLIEGIEHKVFSRDIFGLD